MEIYKNKNNPDFLSNQTLSRIAENINYYYKQKNINDSPNNYLNNKTYFDNFIQRTEISSDYILASRIIDGDFYQIFYDYELYLRDEKEIVIDNIYNNLSKEYNETVVPEDKKNNVKEKINAIKYFINKYEELQDPSFFDLHYNKIDIDSEGYSNVKDLYNFLNKTDNKNLFYYCLIANIIIINKHKNNIYLKIHYMSRVQMIRYILTVANSDSEYKEKLSPKKLPKLVKKYMLDIGSDNIYDLTLY
jgi:predicted small metal-binding protein